KRNAAPAELLTSAFGEWPVRWTVVGQTGSRRTYCHTARQFRRGWAALNPSHSLGGDLGAVKTLIKNATVVLPQGEARTNVLIDGPRIARIDPAVHTQADEVVNATGLHLLPGVVDDQVHFREPGLTHKEDLHTATRACAKGGV